MNDLDTLEALARAAHDDPWFADYGQIGAGDHGIGEMDEADDAEFIVALVNARPALIARLRAAERVVEAAERLVGTIERGDEHQAVLLATSAVNRALAAHAETLP